MTPEDFIARVAEPNVSEALARPDLDRTVFNACASIEALGSSIYWLRSDGGLPVGTRDADYKRDLACRSRAFEIVHAVAESQKHGRLTARSSANRPVASADLVVVSPHGLDHSVLGELMLDVGEAIAIDLDGQSRTIAPLASQALNFLRDELEATRLALGEA